MTASREDLSVIRPESARPEIRTTTDPRPGYRQTREPERSEIFHNSQRRARRELFSTIFGTDRIILPPGFEDSLLEVKFLQDHSIRVQAAKQKDGPYYQTEEENGTEVIVDKKSGEVMATHTPKKREEGFEYLFEQYQVNYFKNGEKREVTLRVIPGGLTLTSDLTVKIFPPDTDKPVDVYTLYRVAMEDDSSTVEEAMRGKDPDLGDTTSATVLPFTPRGDFRVPFDDEDQKAA